LGRIAAYAEICGLAELESRPILEISFIVRSNQISDQLQLECLGLNPDQVEPVKLPQAPLRFETLT